MKSTKDRRMGFPSFVFFVVTPQNAVIWDTDHADQALHDIPIDTRRPAILGVDCSAPALR